MTAARALLSPGDPATLAAADAHLRAMNDGPDGWRIARDLLAAPAETPGAVLASRVRIMGATMRTSHGWIRDDPARGCVHGR